MKSVTINEEENKVYVMVKWDFAYRQARKSDYLQRYMDNIRFKNRIMYCEKIVSPIFNVKHRNKIYIERILCESVLEK